jgi:serine/threonine protein kinase
MPKKEKFGKFVLLEEVETSGLGTEYRAAKLSPPGLEKIVTVLRVRPNLSANAETVKSLMDQVKFAAQLQNPNIVKLFGIGKVDASFYISHEFIEGKSLQAVFNRGKQEGSPSPWTTRSSSSARSAPLSNTDTRARPRGASATSTG